MKISMLLILQAFYIRSLVLSLIHAALKQALLYMGVWLDMYVCYYHMIVDVFLLSFCSQGEKEVLVVDLTAEDDDDEEEVESIVIGDGDDPPPQKKVRKEVPVLR